MPENVAVNPAGETAPPVSDASDGTPVVDQTVVDQTAQSVADAVDPVRAKAKADADDPEIELDSEGTKVRRSELANAIKRRKELDRAAFEKFQQAAEIRRQMDSLRESDPEEYFKLRGMDPLEFAVKRLERELALREATPEQRRAMELEAQLQSERAQRAELEQKQQTQAFEAERQHYVEKLDRELPAAIQKHGLATDPLVFALVAQNIRAQLLSGAPEDYDTAAEAVADTYKESFKHFAATLKYEDAVKQYPEFVKLVRDGDLARAKSALPVKNDGSKPAPAPRAPQTQPKRTWALDDWAALGINRR